MSKKFSKLKWWQVALLAIVVSAVGGLASGQSSKKDRRFYSKKLRQAPWAPPGWLFAPAWTINNTFLLLALQRILNSDIPEKKKLLMLQAMVWVIFFSFGYIYFNRKSPLLAAIWTVSDTAFTAASFVVAYKADRKLAFHYLPLLTWTSFASTVAVYQALENPDPVFKTGALYN